MAPQTVQELTGPLIWDQKEIGRDQSQMFSHSNSSDWDMKKWSVAITCKNSYLFGGCLVVASLVHLLSGMIIILEV